MPGFLFPTDSGLGERTAWAGQVPQKRKRCLGDRQPAESFASGDVTGVQRGQWGIVLGSVGPGDHLPGRDSSPFSQTLLHPSLQWN